MIRWSRTLALAALGGLSAIATAPAGAQSISLQDSFRLGSGAGILCSAQVASSDKAIVDPFDRAYAITCRDASVPVGRLYALRMRGADPVARLATARVEAADCVGAATSETLDDLGAVSVAPCTVKGADVGYRVYSWRRGNTLYVAEGLAGYDSALRIGLRTIVADRPVEGEIAIATTEAGDPAAFARVQAGSLDPQRALAEAYRRNNNGSYAEAAEFFGSLISGTGGGTGDARMEALVNQALQQSNLGNYGEADQIFAAVQRDAGGDPVMARMVRNYRAIHQLNQGRPAGALRVLDAPLARGGTAGAAGSVADLVIDKRTAARLSSETGGALTAGSTGLTAEDKAQILDGQAAQLRGGALRILNRPREASAALDQAIAVLASVRGGRVASTVWLRAQMLAEQGAIAEEIGDGATAQLQYQAAVALVAANYPASPALLNAEARLASYYQRSGQTDAARTLFREIVDANAASGNNAPTLRRLLAPYFVLLAADPGAEAVSDMFKASQLLIRPGVAQTQAVLARELSGGSDDAARLFRQSVNLSRDVERSRVEIARLSVIAQPTQTDSLRLAALRTQLAQVERDQTATQAKLAAFPRYRVVSGGTMALADLQAVLRPGEAYYKMMVVGNDAYAVFATQATARGFKIAATSDQLEQQVNALRETISTVENGERVTYPFDVQLARKLFEELFAPVAGEIAAVRHLVFEPDGAMLRLPANLLVTEQAGVAAYLAKASRPKDDGFDFTDVKWLGRDREISTSVSARAFRDVRGAPRSTARRDYIGFGNNAVPSGEQQTASATRGLLGGSATCDWPIQEWARPISADELVTASRILGGGDGTAVVTGNAFSDTDIKGRSDLAGFRIMHFATHGLVTAPRPECPARPALLTSFGGQASDGLLTFAEIFDLKLDADLIILSACDTAGGATGAATLEAGVRTGGDQALDGLVRAFVGAGGRSVIASHWPVPDDYDATKRLISGLFTAPAGTSIGAALQSAERALMDAPDTSHPYYWAGFAIIGDGAAPVIPARAGTQTSAESRAATPAAAL